jgi:hypothetical protein
MRSELHAPLRAIVGELPRYAENLAELRLAHANLQNIRQAMARPDLRPR